ncbi:hypothetical protein F8M41_003356 [Gigaspora margarita]|uniref:Transmembrane protein n=1 Tax=Gigaspora margarita TaxID=4874 RepID=A0A8H3XCW9_GIGMA|nr:hypothetical protein F8M41_003356 [Gigaspora margarita]
MNICFNSFQASSARDASPWEIYLPPSVSILDQVVTFGFIVVGSDFWLHQHSLVLDFASSLTSFVEVLLVILVFIEPSLVVTLGFVVIVFGTFMSMLSLAFGIFLLESRVEVHSGSNMQVDFQ